MMLEIEPITNISLAALHARRKEILSPDDPTTAPVSRHDPPILRE